MTQIITLKVPAEPKAESGSHGNFDADLVPGETIEVSNERFANFLISEYDLEEVDRRDVETSEEPAAETESADEVTLLSYPDDFPGREALTEARVPFDTAKTLTAEQLAEY